MTDDTSNRGGQDRARVSASEPHEVRYFAQKHGISEDQVRELISQHGNDRETLEQAVAQMRSTTGTA
jgi:hypothetical protein